MDSHNRFSDHSSPSGQVKSLLTKQYTASLNKKKNPHVGNDVSEQDKDQPSGAIIHHLSLPNKNVSTEQSQPKKILKITGTHGIAISDLQSHLQQYQKGKGTSSGDSAFKEKKISYASIVRRNPSSVGDADAELVIESKPPIPSSSDRSDTSTPVCPSQTTSSTTLQGSDVSKLLGNLLQNKVQVVYQNNGGATFKNNRVETQTAHPLDQRGSTAEEPCHPRTTFMNNARRQVISRDLIPNKPFAHHSANGGMSDRPYLGEERVESRTSVSRFFR